MNYKIHKGQNEKLKLINKILKTNKHNMQLRWNQDMISNKAELWGPDDKGSVPFSFQPGQGKRQKSPDQGFRTMPRLKGD